MRQVNSSDYSNITEFLTGVFGQLAQILNSGNEYNRPDRINIVNQINTLLTNSINPLTGLFNTDVDMIYQIASQDASERLSVINVNQTQFSTVDFSAVEALYTNLDEIKSVFAQEIRQIMNNGALNLSKTLERFNAEVQRDIARELSKGITTGDSAGRMRKRIADLIQKEGYTGVSVPSNRANSGVINFTIQSEVKKLVQSSLVRASTTATLERSLDYGNDLVRVSTHADPSPMCQPYAGKIYSITGTSEEYPALADIMFDGSFKKGSGIHHPYCRHSLTVYIPTKLKFNTLTD